jgi:hypothetical protein
LRTVAAKREPLVRVQRLEHFALESSERGSEC